MLVPMRPLGANEAYSILSPDAIFRVEPGRWAQQARTFLDAEVSVEGATEADIVFSIAPLASGSGPKDPTRVAVRTLPIGACPELLAAANRGVDAIGGAGMDVLVARAQRVWQVALVVDGGDARAPLVAAALLASVLLGPIVPPDEVTIYGVRGARVRLDKLGWPR